MPRPRRIPSDPLVHLQARAAYRRRGWSGLAAFRGPSCGRRKRPPLPRLCTWDLRPVAVGPVSFGSTGSEQPSQSEVMERNTTRNRMMMAVGLVMALGAAALMIWTDIEIPILSAIGIAGIALIAVSRRDRRLLG